MATNEIIFKVTADTKGADKNIDGLDTQMHELNDSYKDVLKSNTNLSASFEEVYGDIKPLSTSLGELEDRMYQLALTGQQNTQEFQELQAEAVRYRQVLISVDKSVDQLAEQGRGLGAALQIGTAVTAGYGAVQGSMALLGGESEELQETFVKLQAVQTVLASLEQLKLSLDKQSIVVTKAKAVATGVMTVAQAGWTFATSATTTAMVALRVAMLAIPIVAIIAGIMALVSAIEYFSEEVESAEDANARLNKSFEEGMEIYERAKESFRRNAQDKMEIAKLEGATEEELHQMRLKNLSQEEALRKTDAKLQKSIIEDKRKAYKKALLEGNEDVAQTIKEEIQQHRSKYQDIRALDGQYFTDKKKLELEEQNRLKEEAKKEAQENEQRAKQRAENWKRAQEERKRKEEEEAQKRLDRQRLFEDLMNQNIEDANLRALMIMQTAHQRERDELVKKYGQDTELLKQLESQQAMEVSEFNKKLKEDEDKKKEEQLTKDLEFKNREKKALLELELRQLGENFEAEQVLKQELALLEMEQELAQENLTKSEKLLIEQDYQDKLKALADERKEHEKQVTEDIKNASEQTYSQGLNAMQGLSDAFFGNKLAQVEKGSQAELAIQKKQFEINKKLQIAQAIMQGVQAVQAAYSSGSAIPIVGAVTGPLFAVAAGVQSLLNINKIRNTKFEGGSASISTPSVSAPSIPDASTVAGGTDNESTLTAGLVGGGSGQNTNQAIKVNVVDSEIKAVMDSSAKVEAVSSIG